MENESFDSVSLELIWTRLISTVDEAAAALVRTSFSTVVRDSNDFACVVTNAAGYSIAQATNSVPSFMNTVPMTIRHFMNEFPADQINKGDIFITNDIWQGTGHLPDISVAKPIFLEDRLVGWAGSVAHAPDIGGRIRSADAREVFEEGLQIPIMKVVEAGVMSSVLEKIIRKNVRVPDQTIGDLFAQFTALDIIERQVLLLMKERNLDNLDGVAREIHDRSEKAMRDAIRKIPDGTYTNTTFTDGLKEPIKLQLSMTVRDGEIAVDYAGTDAQVPRSINVCLAYTLAYTCYGLRAMLLPGVPNNEGLMRPLTVTAPKGSILNSAPPAAGGARALVGHFLPAMVIRALADAIPDYVIATVGSPLWCVNLSGTRPDGKAFVNLFFINGGYGASSKHDGVNVLSWPSNISSTPVEMIERLSPLQVLHRRIRTNGGGLGKFRGGNGLEMKFKNTSEGPIVLSFMAERTKKETAADGLKGGQPGQPGEVIIDGVHSDPKSQHVAASGVTFELKTPGGGGYGLYEERDPALLAVDEANGYVVNQ